MIWNLAGTEQQNDLIRQALAACDFPFDLMSPSLGREGKKAINVGWQDLSRYNHGAENHEHEEGAHTVVREVDGRKRVLGLFYLPPYTKVVLDQSLTGNPALAKEVFLAEAAHAVDYHWMTSNEGMRLAVWNAVHDDAGDLADGAHVPESGDLGHGHSWFDGPAGYNTWVGEAFMEAFIRAFAPSVPVTIQLDHRVSAQAAAEIRAALLPAQPEPEPEPEIQEGFPPSTAGAVYWSGGRSKVVHDSHKRIEPVLWYDSLAAAQADGLRACGTCKPR